MLALVQRVSSAQVEVDDVLVGRIGRGLLVYLGVGQADAPGEAGKLAEKIHGLRIFEDDGGDMNLSVQDVQGDVLVVPNFTLMADARKGRRPSFAAAARPQQAEPIYDELVAALKSFGGHVACGAFGKHMTIRSVADGPVNIIVEFPPGQAQPGRSGDTA